MSTTPTRRTRVVWTRYGACGSGSTERLWAATKLATGGVAVTTTTTRERSSRRRNTPIAAPLTRMGAVRHAGPFSAGGYTGDVYQKGNGPGIVLMPDIPGIRPAMLGGPSVGVAVCPSRLDWPPLRCRRSV